MLEIVFKILSTVLEVLLKNKLESKAEGHSVCKALYFMYMNVLAVIKEAEMILTEIDSYDSETMFDGEGIKAHLLEIYRQTQSFLKTSEGLDALVTIYDPETGRSFRFMYVYDLNLFASLDALIANVGSYLFRTGKVIDCDPFEHTPLDGHPLRFSGWMLDRELARIREEEGYGTLKLTSLEYLLKLRAESVDRINRLNAGAEQLSEFIKKHCSFKDFMEVKDEDIFLWRSSRESTRF